MEITIDNFNNIVNMIKSNNPEDNELALNVLDNVELREATKKLLLKQIPLKRSIIIKNRPNYELDGLRFNDIVKCINKNPNDIDKRIFNNILMSWREKGILAKTKECFLYNLN